MDENQVMEQPTTETTEHVHDHTHPHDHEHPHTHEEQPQQEYARVDVDLIYPVIGTRVEGSPLITSNALLQAAQEYINGGRAVASFYPTFEEYNTLFNTPNIPDVLQEFLQFATDFRRWISCQIIDITKHYVALIIPKDEEVMKQLQNSSAILRFYWENEPGSNVPKLKKGTFPHIVEISIIGDIPKEEEEENYDDEDGTSGTPATDVVTDEEEMAEAIPVEDTTEDSFPSEKEILDKAVEEMPEDCILTEEDTEGMEELSKEDIDQMFDSVQPEVIDASCPEIG